MSEEDDYIKKEYAIAQLALQLADNNKTSSSDIISDETLAALYDNRLDHTKRQEMLNLIASDSDTYHRWIALVDSLNTTQASETRTNHANSKSSIFSSFKNWWSNLNDYTLAFGGGLTTAIILAIILLPMQNSLTISDQLNDLYNDFGTDIITQSKNQKSTAKRLSNQRSISSKIVKEEYATIIRTGFWVGVSRFGQPEFEKWGYHFGDFNMIKYDHVNGHSEQEYSQLFELGRFAALIAIPCKMHDNPQLVQSFYSTNKSLLSLFEKSNIPKIALLYQSFNENTDHIEAVCEFSESIKKLIIG